MIRNIGRLDRVARAILLVPLTACSLLAPLPLGTRLLAFAIPAAYLLFSVLRGTRLGNLMMGKSTCHAAAIRDSQRLR